MKNSKTLLLIIAIGIVIIGGAFVAMKSMQKKTAIVLPENSNVNSLPSQSAIPGGSTPTALGVLATASASQPTTVTTTMGTLTITPVLHTQPGGPELAGLDSQTVFSSNTPTIYLTLFVKGAPNSMSVSTQVKYLKTGDVIGPIGIQLTDAADQGQSATFSFSRPTKGWPVGDYTLNFTLADGTTRDLHFAVK